MLGGGLFNQFCQNTCNETAIKANFHFFPVQVYENFSNIAKIFMQRQKKKEIFAAANAMNVSVKTFSFIPHIAS